MIDFKGRVVLLTQSDTRMGQCLARYLSGLGASLILQSDASDLWVPADLMRDRPLLFSTPIDSPRKAEQMIEAGLSRYGRIDAVITGIPEIDGSDSALEDQEIAALLKLYAATPMNVCAAVVPLMYQENQGCIVNMASGAGLLSAGNCTVFGAVSSAIVGFTRSLGHDVRETRIRVNAVVPIVHTALHAAVYGKELPEDVFRTELVSPVIAYLCSHRNEQNGEVFSVGGGRVSRYFTSVAPGYFNLDPSLEDIGNNMERIREVGHSVVIERACDELLLIDV